MSFEWDPTKARTNQRKHGVDFADAIEVFHDPRTLTREDPHPDEERWVTLGLDVLGRLPVVAWTDRGAKVRLISARKATPRERRHYEEDG